MAAGISKQSKVNNKDYFEKGDSFMEKSILRKVEASKDRQKAENAVEKEF